MPLQPSLIKKLAQKFAPGTLTHQKFRGADIAFKTDDAGNPVLLYIGKADEEGNIKGERFVRTLIHNRDGSVQKDHWECKGKAS